MTYNEAFKIGSKIEGRIKCTYMTIYDNQHNNLFSIQQSKALYGMNFKNGDDSHLDNAIVTQLTDSLYWCDCVSLRYGGSDLRGRISISIPIVQADTQIALKPTISKKNKDSGAPLIPAILTPYAKKLLIEACEKFRAYKWYIYVTAINPTGGTYTKCIGEQYSKPTKEMIDNFARKYRSVPKVVLKNVMDRRAEKLVNLLKADDHVMVKACAFDWNPLDTKNASIIDLETGIEVNLSKELKEASNRVDKAKALLLTATATNII